MASRTSLGRPTVVLGVLLAIGVGCRSQPDPQAVKAEAIRRGDELLKAEQYVQAAAAYRAAVNADPKDGELRLKYLAALRRTDRWEELARQSVIAADMLPGNETALRYAIAGLLVSGRFEDALAKVVPLQVQKPDDPELMMFLAHGRARMRNNWWALQTIDDEMRKGLDLEGARLKVRGLTIASDDAEADRLYRRAFAVAGDNYEAALALGGFLLTKGHDLEAVGILERTAAAYPKHPLLNRALGRYFVQARQNEKGERYLKQAASTGDRPAEFALAELYVASNRIDEALVIVNTIPKDDPDTVANIRAAEIQVQAGKLAPALERAEQVLAKQPYFARALLVKARVMLADGKAAEAVSWARQAVEHDRVSRDARFTLAEALTATGKLTEAFDQYSEAWRGNTTDPEVAKALARAAFSLGRFGIAADLANQSVRLKPGDVEAVVIQVRSHLRLGDFRAADRALASFTGKKDSAVILALEGRILAANGKTELARAAFAKALQQDPDGVEALGGLVGLEVKAGQAARVRPQVDQALARHPREPAYLLMSAEVAAAEKNFARAEKELRVVLDLDGAHENAALMLASLLAEQGRLKDAQQVTEKSLERLAMSSRVRMKLGEILELQGLQAEAQTQYEKVISDNQLAGATTDMIDAFNTASAKLAVLFANQRVKLDQALQMASAAKRYRPDNPLFSDALGWVHVRKERAQLGLPHLETAVSADPANPVFRYHLGAAYEQRGEFAKARTELTRALAASPRFVGADDARALLKAVGK